MPARKKEEGLRVAAPAEAIPEVMFALCLWTDSQTHPGPSGPTANPLHSVLRPQPELSRSPPRRHQQTNSPICHPNTLIFLFTLHPKKLQDKFLSKLLLYFYLRNLFASSLPAYF